MTPQLLLSDGGLGLLIHSDQPPGESWKFIVDTTPIGYTADSSFNQVSTALSDDVTDIH